MMKSSIRAWQATAITVGTAAVLFGVAACSSTGGGGGSSTSGAALAPYNVGVLVDLTGSYQSLGVPEEKAIKLYFDNLNKNGGIDGHPVHLEEVDTTSTNNEAINQLRAFQDGDVVAVLGPGSSGEAQALQPVAAEVQIPTVTMGSSDAIVTPASASTYIYKQYSGTVPSLKAQVEYAKSQGWTKLAMLYANNGYGQDPANHIDSVAKQEGVTLTGKEAFDPSATDMTAQLGTIQATNPDAVLVWGTMPTNTNIAKSAKQIGFTAPIFQSPGAGSLAYLTSDTEGTYVEGSVILAADTLSSSSPQYQPVQDILNAYKAAGYDAPGQFDGNGWDAATLLVNAIRKANDPSPTDTNKTRDAINSSLENNTQKVVGVNGIYTFSPDFHGSTVLDGLAVLKVVSGKFEVKKTF